MPDESIKRARGRPRKLVIPPTSENDEAQEHAAIETDINILRDPWKDKDPLKIKPHPEGWRLRWCNEKYRLHRGWEGWTPVRWDEEIGMNLSNYLMDAPPRFEGSQKMDNFIRLGADTMLCKLKHEYWLARKAHIERKNKQLARSAKEDKNVVLKPGVLTFGKGLETDFIK